MFFDYKSYPILLTSNAIDTVVEIEDHLNGFDVNFHNDILYHLNKTPRTVGIQYLLPNHVKALYKNLNISYKNTKIDLVMESLKNSITTINSINKTFDNFVCSFNGSDTVSRQFLISAMYKFQWVQEGYFSKNFYTNKNRVDGNISNFFDNDDQERFYRKFLINDDESYEKIISINYRQFNHAHNIKSLVSKIKSSFVQIVGETEGTSYIPFVTEKFIYPVVSKTLYIGYGQPGWQKHIEKYYGFRPYNKVFDYRFDQIQNPVIRLVEIMTMLSKFEKLSKADWHDLYLLEQDTIEYNHDWYYSNGYMEKLKSYV